MITSEEREILQLMADGQGLHEVPNGSRYSYKRYIHNHKNEQVSISYALYRGLVNNGYIKASFLSLTERGKDALKEGKK